jgi:hypothetical protein
LGERDAKYSAEILREFSIFFAVLFFTCVVGIIELLPEFGKIKGIYGLVAISIIYFGLLVGVIFSIDKCFWLYEQNKAYAGRFGFNFPEIEPFRKRGRILGRLLIIGVLLVFTLLYFVKIGILS